MTLPSDPAVTTTTVVVMGVAGSGKSTVMHALGQRLGWPWAEADEFHPHENVEKMRAGIALTDEDRRPWLQALARWISAQEAAGRSSIVTCSALKRAYREVLRRGNPSVWFAYLDVPVAELEDRLDRRRGHYMPRSLLDSQLETLEPLEPDEPGATIAADRPPDGVAEEILARLAGRQGASAVG